MGGGEDGGVGVGGGGRKLMTAARLGGGSGAGPSGLKPPAKEGNNRRASVAGGSGGGGSSKVPYKYQEFYRVAGDVPPILQLGQLPPDENPHVKAISIHRDTWARPDTPPGYWEVGFPSSSVVRRLQRKNGPEDDEDFDDNNDNLSEAEAVDGDEKDNSNSKVDVFSLLSD
ncbi:hypothetical protein HDU76_012815 [Blyttiomyces sp. JEL0837]|nr:hypothetical protein HDU76_012815 [Blyttiomyces sp. JEL0837]